jgi:hypothetical protein
MRPICDSSCCVPSDMTGYEPRPEWVPLADNRDNVWTLTQAGAELGYVYRIAAGDYGNSIGGGLIARGYATMHAAAVALLAALR